MPIRIVIADDHSIVRSGLRALLEEEDDIQIIAEAANGTEAVQAIEQNSADILLLDLNMPGTPSPSVAEEVLKIQSQLGIVVLTMHEEEYFLQELFRAGARAFVLKKSARSDLLTAIRAVADGKQFIDPSLTEKVLATYAPQNSRPGANPMNSLTPRETEVCRLLAYGHTSVEMAEKLHLSERTIERHRMRIMRKLGFESRAELVRYAIDHGLLNLE